VRQVEHIMGTAISLEIATWDGLPPAEAQRLAGEAFAWLRLVDERFSTYKEDSEVNRVQRGELRPGEGSADLRAVLATCADLWSATDGYFDVYATGRLDPSGYVKGWSVQVASDRLAEGGSVNHCVNAGGDVCTRGGPEPGQPWRVGIRHPWEAQKLAWVLGVTDTAVATSGVYERGYHVVDPRRGEPATELRSVTVVGPDLGLADAYATAAIAMGMSGLAFLAGLDGYESAVVSADGRAFRSDGLPALQP
jgi:FAD:protein FMN transferase